MLIEDFLSVDNFHFLFTFLQDYAREKLNYKFDLNNSNKKEIGKFMEVIYENNFDTLNKQAANKIVISEFKKILKKKSKQIFLESEKIDKLDTIDKIKPLIDFNKPSQILSSKFSSIFKKQAKEIESHFINKKSNDPKILFQNVIKSLEFKEHDLSKAPKNIREDFLIPQPDIFKNMFNKPSLIENVLILLDSRDRNNNLYSNSHNYSIKLDSILKNVISIELLHAIIPNSEYLVNDNNNTIYFQETPGTMLIASISNGNYTDENDIASQLQIAMNIAGSSSYAVFFDSTTKKFTITSDRTGGSGVFLLKFKGSNEIYGSNGTTRSTYLSNSIGPIIGFSNIDLGNKPEHISQNTSNLSPDRSIYLHINADGKDSFENVEGIKKYNFGKFMKLALTSDFGEPTFWVNPRSNNSNLSDMYKTNKHQIIPEKSEAEKINKYENDFKLFFNPPITIDKLNIQLKNYNENFFNLHGLENSLFFRVEMFNFHYDNILMDYNFPDLMDENDIIEDLENLVEEENII